MFLFLTPADVALLPTLYGHVNRQSTKLYPATTNIFLSLLVSSLLRGRVPRRTCTVYVTMIVSCSLPRVLSSARNSEVERGNESLLTFQFDEHSNPTPNASTLPVEPLC
jgi:hypothetical protein